MEQAIALTGPVADVIAAFEHGETLAKKIKDGRAQKGVPLPPAALEQSLGKGPRAIKDAYETGCETYGDSFCVENDRVARDAFKDILVNLQSTFFQHLFTAQEDDTMQDFGVVVNAATMGRVKGVHVLNEMFMRMAEPSKDWPSPQIVRPRPSFGSQQSQQSENTLPEQDSSFTSPVPGFVWNNHDQSVNMGVTQRSYEPKATPTSTGIASANSQFHFNHSAGITSSPTNHSYTSSDATNLTIRSEDVDLARFPAPPTKKSFREMFSKSKPNVEIAQETLSGPNLNLQRPNSISSDSKSVHGSSSGASLLSGASPEVGTHLQISSPSAMNAKKITNKIPLHESPPAEYRKRLNNKPRPKPTTTAIGSPNSPPNRPGLTHSISSARKLSFLGGPRSPKEDFAGFCEGAYFMQRTGHDGMKIRNESVSMTGQKYYWACANSKCCFEGHAVPKENGHKKTNFGFDEDILESHGLKYRWSFLAKSHTTISNSKSGYEYQCVFCIGRGVTPFRVKGNKKFIEHVATHQGQTPNQYKMPRFNYVVGRLASPWENFDINLPAATAMELETMETPTELEALEQRLPEMEAPLERPVRTTRPAPGINDFSKCTDGSGLGIRMGADSAFENPGTYPSDPRLGLQYADPGRRPAALEAPMQSVRGTDHRSKTKSQHDNGFRHPPTSPTSGEQKSSVDEPLDGSWSNVRDSIQSLHPAPLFARKPVPQPSSLSSPKSPGQAQNPVSGRNHPNAQLSHFDESDDFEINPHDPTLDDISTYIPSGKRVSPQDPSPKSRVVQSRQASLGMRETSHEISTPEMWHPGTRWMD